MILEDFHVHTTFCDGKDTPEDVVLSAISKGLTRLGFSGHSHTPHDESYCMSPEKTEIYRSEIQRLKEKYAERIEIFCGVEQDFFSDTDLSPFDYAIGSVHYIRIGGGFVPIDESPEILRDAANKFFGGNIYALAECYYIHESAVIEKTGANVIGHFDLISKFNEGGRLFDENNRRYIDAAYSAVDELVEFGIPFEINTGAITRGYRTAPYPTPIILKRIAEKGGCVVLSSDSHSAKNLCAYFNECEELCNSFGLKPMRLKIEKRAN